jgi:transcription elongation GreA/GreB family factor
MDKQKLLELVVKQLEEELGRAHSAAKSSHEAATAEENRPENQFDTRALEASFLARGQAARVAELEHGIKMLKELPIKELGADTPIQGGALVTLDCEGAKHLHFVLPVGAGIQVALGKEKISVVTYSSPLGAELLGKSAGDSFTFKRAGASKDYDILKVE